MASCLVTCLSFDRFKDKTEEDDESKEEDSQAISFSENSSLEYSTLYLLTHFTQSRFSTRLASELALFFQSGSGWQWLQRLETVHRTSFGDLQLMQSQLKSWSNSPDVDGESRNILGGFLLVLAKRRYDDSEDLPAENVERHVAMSLLGTSYWEHEVYDRAENLLVRVMETTSRVLGEEHPDTLIKMGNLALIYSFQGRWTEAEKLHVQVFEIEKRVLGEEHPNTLISMNNLTHTYKGMGRHDEATELMSIVIDLCTKKMGANHPYTLSSVESLTMWSHT